VQDTNDRSHDFIGVIMYSL